AAAQTPAATTAAQAASVQVGTSAILMAPQVMTPPLQTTSAAAQTPAATTAAQAASVQIDTSAIPAATQGVTPPLQTTVAAAQTPAATTAAQAVLVQVGTSAIPVAAQGVTPPLQTTSTAAQTPAATTAAQAASVQVGTSAIPSATQGATPLRQTTSAAAQTPVATTAAQVASVQVGTSAIPVAAQGVTPPLQTTSTAAQTPAATTAAQAASVQVGTSAIPSATQGATPQLQTASASAQTLAVATATQAGGTMFSQLGEQTIFAQGGQPSLESRYRDAGAFETTGSTLNQAMGQHGSVAATFSASVQKTDSLMDTTLTGTQTDSASTNAAPATGSVQDAQVKNILSSAVVQAQSGPISAVIFRQKTAVSFQNMILQDNGAIGSLAVSMQGAPDAQSGKMLSTSDTQATVLHPVAISSVPVAQGMAASSSNIGGQTSSSDGQNRKEERQTSTVPQTYAQSVSMQTVTQSSTPVQAQPAAEQSRMTTQVADAVKDAFANQRSELRVHLSPEDLGGITIKMVSQGGVLTVSIVADNHHTCQMLATGLDHLKSAIQSSGVPVQKAEVSYTQADNTGQTPNQQNQAGQNPQQHRRQTPQTFRQSQPNTSEQQEAGFASFVNLFA
ncbi:MAG: flagellar hook-length control protein FliK, partial [Ethanoligenens sp.]